VLPGFASPADEKLAGLGGRHLGLGQLSILPYDIDNKAAARTETLYRSGGPCTGQGGKQDDFAAVGMVVALQQHFGHPRASAKVSINLEGRMHIEEVGVGSIFEQVLDHQMGMVTIMHACPKINLPAHRPTGGAVTALGEGGAAGLCQFRGMCRADLASGMQAEEVVEVPMLVFRVVDILVPFLELAVLLRCL